MSRRGASTTIRTCRRCCDSTTPDSPTVCRSCSKPPGKRKLTDEEAKILAGSLRRHEPWLEWTGKREKKWFDVDPVALHIHERVSAQAAIRIAARQDVQRGLWADPQQEYLEAVQFYKHDVDWANRLILGDSLAVMNSLAAREDLAGKVQMIYVDPPYGIGFRSNFQSLIRNRDVKDRDEDLTREPEMVKAYRDTWTLGVHTYLAYLRDRLTVARDLLTDSGSIFVQIGDVNVHRVRTVMDEVFGDENFMSLITFMKASAQTSNYLSSSSDYLLWYAREKSVVKYRTLLLEKKIGESGSGGYINIESPDGTSRRMSREEQARPALIPNEDRVFQLDHLRGTRSPNPTDFAAFTFEGQTYNAERRWCWKTNEDGLNRLAKSSRLMKSGSNVNYKRYIDDFAAYPMTTTWQDTSSSFMRDKVFVVQTSSKVLQRCLLMTTDPGDLVLDPTCGSGTTAYVAEQWGRRWITIDTSRVAIALARQRLLTSKFDYYETGDGSDSIGPAGFKYQTVPHVTLGGIAQNVALDPIFVKWEPVLEEKLATLNTALTRVGNDVRANLLAKLESKRKNEGKRAVTDADKRRWVLPETGWGHWEVPFDADPVYPDALRKGLNAYRKAWRGKIDEMNTCIVANADQEVLVDQPEVRKDAVRVSGPFTVEAVHPPEQSLGTESPIGGVPEDLDSFGDNGTFNTDGPSNAEAFIDTMIRLLRNDGVRFQGNGVAEFTRLEPLTDGDVLHADGEWESAGSGEPLRVAVSFGPQYGPVTAKQVEDSLGAAHRRGYDSLVFAGFSFDGPAQAAIESDPNPRVRAHMAHIAPDVNMGDLLKETRDSHLFSVSGSPRTTLTKQENGEYVVEMEGVDIYDPVSNTIVSESARGVAGWFLDSDYDGRTFCISQAFFPDSNAWDRLKRALKSVVDAEAFAAFSGTRSLPFPPGKHARAAVKVIDPRGNEVMKVHSLGQEKFSQAGRRTHESPATGARDEFERLSREWRTGRPRGADVAQMVKHPAYERIIGMGTAAIPLILQELEREVDHWFWALHTLTGADPVPQDSMGNLSAMAEAWLNWGRSEGYVR